MTAQQLNTNNGNLELCNLIAQKIVENPQRRITFAEYMDLVLYHSQHGYYASNTAKIGAQGDFFTSPHLSADFGELLAEQFVDMWHCLGKPVPFTLVEMGAGQGLLAGDVLRYLRDRYSDCFEVLEYFIVEKSAALRAEQQQRLQAWNQIRNCVSWCTLEEIAIASITGCCFSNELVDALPVHQITVQDGQLQEVYVTVTEAVPNRFSFAEVTAAPSTPHLAEYFNLVNIELPTQAYPEGYRSEVNLAALDWLSTVADRLQRGYLLTIDYGYTAARYYNPARHQGTLQCYYRHTLNANPYQQVGQQDLTAHVDFTALERHGDRCGFNTLGFIQQGLFLMALGLGDRIAALSKTETQDSQEILNTLRRRDALHSLMNPMGLGNFGVLIQSKGLTAEEQTRSLKGLSLPLG
jgi:SAM-dependent MidA family methyltransferase